MKQKLTYYSLNLKHNNEDWKGHYNVPNIKVSENIIKTL